MTNPRHGAVKPAHHADPAASRVPVGKPWYCQIDQIGVPQLISTENPLLVQLVWGVPAVDALQA